MAIPSLTDFYHASTLIDKHHSLYVNKNGEVKCQGKWGTFFTRKSTFQRSTLAFWEAYKNTYKNGSDKFIKNQLQKAAAGKPLRTTTIANIKNFSLFFGTLTEMFTSNESTTLEGKIEPYLKQLANDNNILKFDLPVAKQFFIDYLNDPSTSKFALCFSTTNVANDTQTKGNINLYKDVALRYLRATTNSLIASDLCDLTVKQRERYLRLLSFFNFNHDPYIIEKLNKSIMSILSSNPKKSLAEPTRKKAWEVVFGKNSYTSAITTMDAKELDLFISDKLFKLKQDILNKYNIQQTNNAKNNDIINIIAKIDAISEYGIPFSEIANLMKVGTLKNKTSRIVNKFNERPFKAMFYTYTSINDIKKQLQKDLERFPLNNTPLKNPSVENISVAIPAIAIDLPNKDTTQDKISHSLYITKDHVNHFIVSKNFISSPLQTNYNSSSSAINGTPITIDKRESINKNELNEAISSLLAKAIPEDSPQYANTLNALTQYALNFPFLFSQLFYHIGEESITYQISISMDEEKAILVDYKSRPESPLNFDCCYRIMPNTHAFMLANFSMAPAKTTQQNKLP